MGDGPSRTMRDPDGRGRHSTAIRFDPDVHARLVAEAGARMVSINWVVNRLVAEGLERLVPVDEMKLTRDRSEPTPADRRELDPDGEEG